jgi:hypothetical protein
MGIMQRLKTKVGNLLVPGNNDPWPEVRDTLNRSRFSQEKRSHAA